MSLELFRENVDINDYLKGVRGFSFHNFTVNGHEFYLLYPSGFHEGLKTYVYSRDFEPPIPTILILTNEGKGIGNLYKYFGKVEVFYQLNNNILNRSIEN
ncbi:MAG: hypothetical protein J1E95_05885, partial [Muribaculaceae bacterium]|nr:hypothetical protein [Muribaculaceae bacterium]